MKLCMRPYINNKKFKDSPFPQGGGDLFSYFVSSFLMFQLGIEALFSIKSYCEILSEDLTRNGVTIRKHILESMTSPIMRQNGLLSELASFLGARRKAIYCAADVRAKVEEDRILQPFADRMAQRPPVGEKIISKEWRLKAGDFYESHTVSDPVKGHHQVYKVTNVYIMSRGIICG